MICAAKGAGTVLRFSNDDYYGAFEVGEKKRTELWIAGTGLVSGAEYLLRDYLVRSVSDARRVLLTSSVPEVVVFFNSISGLEVRPIRQLNPVGAGKGDPLKIVRKLLNFFTARNLVRKAVMELRPDVVIGNNTGDAAYMPGARWKAPNVLFIYDIVTSQWFLRAIIESMGGRTSVFIVASQAVSRSLPVRMQNRAIVLYAGIDLSSTAKPSKKVKEAGSVTLGYVANIEERKDPVFLAEGISAAMARNPTLRISLRMVYRVLDQNLFERVKSILDSSGASVEYLGAVERSELPGFYSSIDALCVTSRNDPFPTVVIEALAAGVPVLGRAVDGIPEMFETGVQGRLFPDMRGYIEAIDEFAHMDGMEHEEYRLSSYEWARRMYDLSNRVRLLDQRLNELADSAGPPAIEEWMQ
jgi:glycosyltransferase involved in cell wall biosynthesis